jgi:hypothetical protein
MEFGAQGCRACIWDWDKVYDDFLMLARCSISLGRQEMVAFGVYYSNVRLCKTHLRSDS